MPSLPVLYLPLVDHVRAFVPQIGWIDLHSKQIEEAEEELSALLPDMVREYISQNGAFPDVTDDDLPIVKRLHIKTE